MHPLADTILKVRLYKTNHLKKDLYKSYFTIFSEKHENLINS